MDKKELDIILKEGEGYKIEFKENLGNLEKEMVSFANSSGGRIFLGVTDGGNIKGIRVTNKLRSRIQDLANNCRPKIRISMETLDDTLIINVREGEDKPHECSSGFYKRIGPNSQKMTRDEIIDFIRSEGKVRFDELVESRFNYPEDFDEGRFQRFLQLAGISIIDDVERLLVNLGVAER